MVPNCMWFCKPHAKSTNFALQLFRRAMTLWMKKHRQEDKDGVQSYPWETKCLSAGEFSEWKVCCCLVVC